MTQREEPSLDLDASGRASGDRGSAAAAPTIRAKFRPSHAVMELVAVVPASDRTAPRAHVARDAQMLSMAHLVERRVRQVPSYAHAARALGLTRARLSPAMQQRVLAGEIGATERSLRRLVREPDWAAQEEHLRTMGTVPAGRQATSNQTGD